MGITSNSGPERRSRALVLGGDPVALDLMQRSLEARSFATVGAEDGTRGVALLIDELLDLDVVVVDVDLPERDARSLARLVRLAGGERDLAIVVVAGELDPAARGELLSLGVDAIGDWREGPRAIAGVVADAVRSRRRPATPAPAPDLTVSVPTAPPRPAPVAFGGWSLLPA